MFWQCRQPSAWRLALRKIHHSPTARESPEQCPAAPSNPRRSRSREITEHRPGLKTPSSGSSCIGEFSRLHAHHNEWYEEHMYAAEADWHAQNLGPQEKAGYKDPIPRFTAAKWDPDAWAALFKRTGARLVMAMGQHHDNFALWDSDVTRFNAKKMGPHRDLLGELAKALRKQGLRLGISNHGVENFTFVNPTREIRARAWKRSARNRVMAASLRSATL